MLKTSFGHIVKTTVPQNQLIKSLLLAGWMIVFFLNNKSLCQILVYHEALIYVSIASRIWVL